MRDVDRHTNSSNAPLLALSRAQPTPVLVVTDRAVAMRRSFGNCSALRAARCRCRQAKDFFGRPESARERPLLRGSADPVSSSTLSDLWPPPQGVSMPWWNLQASPLNKRGEMALWRLCKEIGSGPRDFVRR